MGDAGDDARDTEEFRQELECLHDSGDCDFDCPYCNKDYLIYDNKEE